MTGNLKKISLENNFDAIVNLELVSTFLNLLDFNYSVIDIDGNYIVQNNNTVSNISGGLLNAADIDEQTWDDCKKIMLTQEKSIKEEQFKGRFFLSIKKPIIEDDICKGIIVLSLDITEKKKAEIAKLEFLRNMNHDIRTPLVGIYSLAKYLEDDEEDPDKRELIADISLSAERLTAVLEQVLQVADSGDQITKIEPCDINQVVTESTDLVAAAIKNKRLNLIVDCPSRIIELDKYRIGKIILNLLNNAIKFTQQGTIKLTVEIEPVLKITVEDTGIGIPQESINIIFDNFTKLKPSGESVDYLGSGTGLYIAKKFAEELNGTITVESELGNGSKFVFSQTA